MFMFHKVNIVEQLKENLVIISLVKYNHLTFETMDYRAWHLSFI